ncbi:NAD(P)-binding protein [Punctularia strigosozonata HHB-11173 SS5]|uniref:NAD(P)-binding protein n=1 Tax=Punctularia strigosozonata (strain HHB-11173) TaxID=741275 RepID=UPI0004417685|nr:NAD(P)-binding protein [Punctularia strigosozonata HHB-11173 SS5]EIN06966.1 NAD(P)-binding protein [Punctularia strigosozonata HHB-11173 SS5]
MALKVAVAGATGTLGPYLVQGLVGAGIDVTVLSRQASVSGLPAAVTVRQVDYDSVESLTAALQGQDAVVSVVAQTAVLKQKALIDAAVAAGVKRFFPAEFGVDTLNPKVRALPIKAHKVEIQNYLAEVSAKTDLTYTILLNGPFLDAYIAQDFLLGYAGLKSRRVTLFDGGDVAFSATTVPHIIQSVISILHHLEETENRAVYVEDITLTQNQILRLAQELTPGETWTTVPVSTAEIAATAYEALGREGMTEKVAIDFILVAVWGQGMSGKFAKTDNELLGITPLTEEDVKAMIKKALDSF